MLEEGKKPSAKSYGRIDDLLRERRHYPPDQAGFC